MLYFTYPYQDIEKKKDFDHHWLGLESSHLAQPWDCVERWKVFTMFSSKKWYVWFTGNNPGGGNDCYLCLPFHIVNDITRVCEEILP